MSDTAVLLHESTTGVLARWPEPVWTDVLSDAERGRAGRMRWSDDFVAAHLLVREAVAALIGGDPSAVVVTQTCTECGGPHGRPAVDGAEVSWTHTKGYVAAAASPTRLGIDVELLSARQPISDQLLARVATQSEAVAIRADRRPEAAFLRMWVAKEALVKVGAIELDDFGSTDVSSGQAHDVALTVTEVDDVVLGLATAARGK